MIVCPNLYSGTQQGNAAATNMNCGLQQQFDEVGRHSVFSGLTVDSHWLRQPIHNIVKQEPRDETDYTHYGGEDKTTSFQAPLTPPGLPAVDNYGFPTPPQPDYSGAGSPQQVSAAELGGHREAAAARPPPSHSPGDKPAPPAQMTPPSPSSEGILQPQLHQPDKHDHQDTSQSSNSENEYYENGDSLKRLQMALQRTGMIVSEEKLQCPMCDFFCNVRSQFNEHLLSHETKCTACDFNAETGEKLREHMKTTHENLYEEDMWTEEEPGLNTPKVNSQGKVKTFRCKQCEFSAVTKLEFWEHSRSHIKQERLLTCPKCPFVTEYKHHLEYHLRNHFGSKPFKCDKCSYSCVNKSMLNSHLKSHSNVYQFRCADCTYATKYCHSLKLHLRKYNHNPAMVLNPDGSPNPLPIVDVYGTRRGPKQKPKGQSQAEKQLQHQHQQQHHQQPPHPQHQHLPVPVFNPYSLLPAQMPYYNILNGFAPFAFHQDMKLEEKNNNVEKAMDDEQCEHESDMDREDKTPLDLTCPDAESGQVAAGGGGGNAETPVFKNRRKGKAFKLERIALRLQQHSDEEGGPTPTPTPAPVPPSTTPTTTTSMTTTATIPTKWDSGKTCEVKSCEADSEQQKSERRADKQDQYNCSYCDISFKDIVMYTMHMGYHGYQDPFTCNMCGQQTSDKVAFFLHIARTSHS